MDIPQGVKELYRGRGPANKIVRVPPPGVVTANTTTSPATIKFPKAGIVLSMIGQTKEATDVAAANIALRVLQGADRELVTDGSAASYAPYLMLFGVARNWFPLYARVVPGEVWQINWRNESAATPYTPDLAFGVWED